MAGVEDAIGIAVSMAIDRKIGELREAIRRIEERIPPSYVTVAEAARTLGCHPNTVRQMIKSGSVRYRRVGRLIRVDAASLRGDGG